MSNFGAILGGMGGMMQPQLRRGKQLGPSQPGRGAPGGMGAMLPQIMAMLAQQGGGMGTPALGAYDPGGMMAQPQAGPPGGMGVAAAGAMAPEQFRQAQMAQQRGMADAPGAYDPGGMMAQQQMAQQQAAPGGMNPMLQQLMAARGGGRQSRFGQMLRGQGRGNSGMGLLRQLMAARGRRRQTA